MKEGGPKRRWLRRLLIASVVTPAVIALVGFVILPPIVRHVAEGQLAKVLGRRVAIGRVRMNPFALSLTIENFQIFEPDGATPFVGFTRLYVNTQLSSVYRRGPVVREFRLDSPRVHAVRLKATPDAWADTTAYNFSDILARLASGPKAPEPPPPEDKTPARFSINNVRITDGEIVFEDKPLRSVHKISAFDLGVPFVSTLPTFIDTFVEPGMHVTVDGTPFAILGRTKPFKDSLETTIELRANDFDLTRYLPYVPVPLRFDVASALLDVNVDVSFVRPASESARLTAKGRVALEKILLREKGGAPLIGLQEFEVLIGNADLTAQKFRFDRITVAGLDVHARRLANGTLNLERLAPEPARRTKGSPPAQSQRPVVASKPGSGQAAHDPAPRFEIGEFVLKSTALHARDETVHPPFEMTVDPLSVSARGVSNAPGARAMIAASLRATPGGTLRQEGTLTLEPLTAAGTITLDGIDPARFAPYYQDQIAFDVRDGRVRLGAGYRYQQSGPERAPEIKITDAFVELTTLALRRRGMREDFFSVRDLAVRAVDVDPGKRTARVGQISTADGRLRAERNEAGIVDLSTLVPEKPRSGAGGAATAAGAAKTASATPAVAAAAAPPPGSPSGSGSSVAETAGAKESPWTVDLGRFQMDGWNVRFEDRAVKPKAVLSIAPIAIKASAFGTSPGSRGTFDVRIGINKLGRLTLAGTASLEPTAADVRIDLRGLEILPFQPYFADQVNLVVTDGALSVKGQAKVEIPRPPPPRSAKATPAPAPDPKISFTGDIDVSSLASVDGTKHEEFLKWKSLHFGQLAVSTVPVSLAIHEIALTDFYSRLMIFPDAHFNLEDIVAKPAGAGTVATTKKGARPPPKAPPTGPAVPPPNISIGQVTLQGGHVSFSDQLIRPHYSAELTDLAGRVSGLSVDGATQADVDIRGSVDHSGNLSIVGKANPLAKSLFVDVKVNLDDFELPPTSPYAAKYAGYGIDKGKLALALDYHIADKKLDAKNRLIVQQFTFGDKVPGPDATHLPVRLAVALLKDRHGVIDIDLPISGSLDSPDFKIWPAILKVLGNLIVKAVTAPFSMIASLFGGGDELSHLDFPQGVATLDAKSRSKLESLSRALRERPGLSFEIEGGADRDRDRESLKRNLYERKLKDQKMLEIVATGAAVSNPEDVKFDAPERPRLVEAAYRTATFPKPRNVFGRPKDLPVDEMEKLMLANTIVDEDALRLLAERRATVVREAVAKMAPDGATRLFLVAPHVTGGGAVAAKGPGNRVEFRLKKD